MKSKILSALPFIIVAVLIVLYFIPSLPSIFRKYETVRYYDLVQVDGVKEYVFVDGDKSEEGYLVATVFDDLTSLRELRNCLSIAKCTGKFHKDDLTKEGLALTKYMYVVYNDGNAKKLTFYGEGSGIVEIDGDIYTLSLGSSMPLDNYVLASHKDKVYLDNDLHYVKDAPKPETFNIQKELGDKANKAWLGE